MRYDFIEIGTSDFDTIIELCPIHYRGISIDPIIHYLNKLPNKPLVHKLPVAISNENSFNNSIYYISERNIELLNLPWWVRGCNSFGKPHATVLRLLKERGIKNTVIESMLVPSMTIQTLFNMYDVTELRTLKMDTEGHCLLILEDLMKQNVLPKILIFEYNELQKEQNYDFLRSTYDVIRQNDDNITMRLK